MADLINFTLPTIDDSTDEKTMKQIKNYLFQLSEQMKFYLNNIDSDNFTDAYNQQLSKMATAQTTNSNKLSVTEQLLKKFKTQLTTAMQSAVNLISGNSGGYVVLHDSNKDSFPDEILIMNTSDINTATKIWRWNKHGLMFNNSGYFDAEGWNTTVAIDMEGHINANYIRAGILQGIEIKAVAGVVGGFVITPTRLYSKYEADDGTNYRAMLLCATSGILNPSGSLSTFISVDIDGNSTYLVDYAGNVFCKNQWVWNYIDIGTESVLAGTKHSVRIYKDITIKYYAEELMWIGNTDTIVGPANIDECNGTIAVNGNRGSFRLGFSKGDHTDYFKEYYVLCDDVLMIAYKTSILSYGFRHRFKGNVYIDEKLYVSGDFVSSINCTHDNGYQLNGSIFARIYPTSWLALGIDTKYLKLYGKALYFGDTLISSSDERLKNNIKNMADDIRYEKLFKNLIPASFKYNKGTSDRSHMGFIAQRIKEALLAAGFTTQEIAAYCEYESDQEGFDGYECGVRYEEIIPLNTLMIQKCLSLLEQQQIEINQLKGA